MTTQAFTRRRFRSKSGAWTCACVAAACVLSAFAGGCGAAAEKNDRAGIPGPVADQLARQTDGIASRLARSDGCGARSQALALRQNARYAIATGQIPSRLRPGLRAGVSRLIAQIHCTPPAPTTTSPAASKPGPSSSAPSCSQIDARKQALQEQHQAIDAQERAIDQQYKGPAAAAHKQPLEARKRALDQQQHELDVQRGGCR
jgi:hypothetical protein